VLSIRDDDSYWAGTLRKNKIASERRIEEVEMKSLKSRAAKRKATKEREWKTLGILSLSEKK
jgi:hypothetical protein